MNATIISPMDRVNRDLYATASMKCRMPWLEVIVKRVHGFISIVAGVAVALSSVSAVLGAPTESVLYSFKAEPDGDQPFSEVIKDSAGNLYGTTLIAANIADSGILSFDACFPDSVVGFVPASMFENARYFEYFVRTAKANLLASAPATAQKNINLEILTQVLIPLPPLAEQQRMPPRWMN